MRIKDLHTRTKISFSFALVLVTFAACSVAVLFSIRAINNASAESHGSLALAAKAEHAMELVMEQTNALRGYVLKGEGAFKATYEQARTDLDALLDGLVVATDDVELESRVERLRSAEKDWRGKIGDPVVALMADPATRPQAINLTGVKSLGEIRAAHAALIDRVRGLVDGNDAAQAGAERAALRWLVSGSAAALGVAVLLASLLVRSLATPVVAMTEVMTRLAAGDNAVEVSASDRRDEVGRMAAAVLTFKRAALEKLSLEADAVAVRRATEAERANAETVRLGEERERAAVVDAVAVGLESLSNGDLTIRLDRAFSPEYEKLRGDFNRAVAKLQSAVGVIAGAADGIRSGAGEISRASDDLARRTERQAASLEETAAALDQVTATVGKTASGARQANAAVEAARADADTGAAVVGEAVTAMEEIAASSGRITQIIGVIDEIAFQTNLLALNAGVEAARAGDAGRGFAVVASEVRGLAQRSAEAAKEIKALISASSRQVETGVDLVNRTGEVLGRIVANVGSVTALVADMTASALEQSTALGEVNIAINAMDQSTQQNAAMVEQTTAASGELAREADDMGRLVQQFRIGAPAGRQDAGPARRRAA